ncbi:hypothetical protein ONZ45_g11290 [Pleurotus djamor]|nr:hypothetical protein ONZ45_g11290 [Pleurotus djamor]
MPPGTTLKPGEDGVLVTLQPPNYPTIWMDNNTACILLSLHHKSLLTDIPGYPKPIPREPTLLSFAIRDVPGMGSGMFAGRIFAYGDMIESERPLLIFPRAFPIDTTGQKNPRMAALAALENTLELALKRMNPFSRTRYLGLHNCHVDEECPKLLGIAQTNSFGIHFMSKDPAGEHCSPNAVDKWDPVSLSRQLYAIRPIAPGEAITVHYIPLSTPFSERDQLLSYYKFQCRCKACRDPKSFLLRLNAVKDSLPAIVRWCSNPALPADLLLKPAMTMHRLIEDEGQQAHDAYPKVLFHLACIYTALGAETTGLMYLKKRLVWDKIHDSLQEESLTRVLKGIASKSKMADKAQGLRL